MRLSGYDRVWLEYPTKPTFKSLSPRIYYSLCVASRPRLYFYLFLPSSLHCVFNYLGTIETTRKLAPRPLQQDEYISRLRLHGSVN